MFPDDSPINQPITLHTDPRSGTRCARVAYSSGTYAAFAFDPADGTLVETVEWVDPNTNQTPDWAWAGEVNPALASDPDLCERVEALLRANNDEVTTS